MKIVYISNSTLPSREANSVHVMRMCAAFARVGHHVTLIGKKGRTTANVFQFYGIPDEFRIRLFGEDFGGVHKLSYAVRSAIGAIRARPDLVYGRNAYSLLVTARFGLPTVYESHAPPGSAVRAWVEQRLLASRSCIRLVVISGALANEYRQRFSTSALPEIIVAHDGADPPSASQPGDGDGTLRVGYFGQLYPGKGMEIILPLAELLPDIEFHVFGGSEDDIDYWKARSSAGNLTFKGFLPHGHVANVIPKYDILLAPYQQTVQVARGGPDVSRWMSPLKIFEYMAAGRPIIASDLPVLREILEDGHTALLVAPNDVAAWAHAINILRDRALRERIGRNAAAILAKEFTWGRRAETVLHGLRLD